LNDRVATRVRARDLLGVPVALTDYEGAMQVMDELIARREPGYVCAIAVHALMTSRHDAGLSAALAGSTMNVPDGKPLVWALNALGESLQDRVYGPELMERYVARSAERGHRVWLHGGYDASTLAALEHALLDRHPGLVIAGRHSPPHRLPSPAEEREVVEMIDSAGADVVFVGLGAPRQEKWMAQMRPQVQAPVLIGVGAAFDFLAGLKRQAPPWMQARGLEWAFRLSQEPLRLFPRYARYNPAFVAAFARQYLRERRSDQGM
jgi:N-acetylglucosaminyldiphosphoundecaprenol N-acetyl-beta-D-mannosaminyltransferase